MSVSINRENPLHQQYLAQLSEYEDPGRPERHDYRRGSQGWKIHLNVVPENVNQVSAYLKTGGFHHKFISGANIDNGKIFTVYFGSKALTEKLVREVQDNIGNLLEIPKAKGDILVSPNIAARFGLYHHPDYINQGYFQGIPLKRYYNEDDLPGSIEISSRLLQFEFGDYFGGGIEYYDPGK